MFWINLIYVPCVSAATMIIVNYALSSADSIMQVKYIYLTRIIPKYITKIYLGEGEMFLKHIFIPLPGVGGDPGRVCHHVPRPRDPHVPQLPQ